MIREVLYFDFSSVFWTVCDVKKQGLSEIAQRTEEHSLYRTSFNTHPETDAKGTNGCSMTVEISQARSARTACAPSAWRWTAVRLFLVFYLVFKMGQGRTISPITPRHLQALRNARRPTSRRTCRLLGTRSAFSASVMLLKTLEHQENNEEQLLLHPYRENLSPFLY